MYYTLKRKMLFACFFIFACSFNSKANSSENFINSCEEEICNSVPVIICPMLVWLKPTESEDPSRTGSAVAEPGGPDCGEPVISYHDEVFTINRCHYIITRVWRAEDPNNPALFDTCHQTIKVVDEEAPVINNAPQDTVVFTNTFNCETNVRWETPEIYDNSLLDYVEITGSKNGQTFPVINGQKFSEGITTVTITAYDFCDKVTSHSFTITVMCSECQIVCPPNATVSAGDDISPNILGFAQSATTNSNCGNVEIEFDDFSMNNGCNGQATIMRVWTGTFQTMSTMRNTCTQVIQITSASQLSISNCPADIAVNENEIVNWNEPNVTNGGFPFNLTSNFQPGISYPVGVTTVTYTATDDCGDQVTCSFEITVSAIVTNDNCPEDINVSCDENGTATVDWTPPVYDGTCNSCPKGRNIPGFVYIGSLNGSNYYCSRHNYTFDQAQKRSAKLGGYIVSINSQEENDFIQKHIGSASALIGLSDYRKEGQFVWESGEPVTYTNWFLAQPNDRAGIQDYVELLKSSGQWNDYDNDLALEFVLEMPCSFVTQTDGPTPGEKLDPGSYTVSYVVADGCGYEEFCEFQITVSGDITMQACPEDIVVVAPKNASEVAITWKEPSFSSCCEHCLNYDCIEVTRTGPHSGSFFLTGSTTQVTYTAVDQCGNSVSCAFSITVESSSDRIVQINQNHIGEETSFSQGADTEDEFIEEEVDVEFENQIESGEEIQTINIYPNPTSTFINIEIPQSENISFINIIDHSGRQLKNVNNDRSVKQIDVSNLPQGMYFIKVEYEDRSFKIERFVKL